MECSSTKKKFLKVGKPERSSPGGTQVPRGDFYQEVLNFFNTYLNSILCPYDRWESNILP